MSWKYMYIYIYMTKQVFERFGWWWCLGQDARCPVLKVLCNSRCLCAAIASNSRDVFSRKISDWRSRCNNIKIQAEKEDKIMGSLHGINQDYNPSISWSGHKNTHLDWSLEQKQSFHLLTQSIMTFSQHMLSQFCFSTKTPNAPDAPNRNVSL